MIGKLGIVAGALAFWLTLPPVELSTAVVPVVLGALAGIALALELMEEVERLRRELEATR